jgi:hypothetical protein
MTRISVVCVTTGRETLRTAWDAVLREIDPARDEAWLVEDGPGSPFVREIWNERPPPGGYRTLADGPHGDWGHTPRQAALAWCGGDIAVHVDDDDVLAEGALAALRRWADTHPGAVLAPRMVDAAGVRTWDRPVVEAGQVGTGNFVHPLKVPLGAFGTARTGDWEFVRRTLALNPSLGVVFVPETTLLLRPRERPVNPRFRDGAYETGEVGRWDLQGAWQTWFGQQVRSATILDVGAGLGRSRTRLESGSNLVALQDIGPGLPVDHACPVEALPSSFAEHVTAFDVLEHVVDDSRWLAELGRLATQSVFLSTPNVWVSRCGNPYHVREYSPPLLVERLRDVWPDARVRRFVLEGTGLSARVRETGADEWLLTEAPNLGVWIDVARGCGAAADTCREGFLTCS